MKHYSGSYLTIDEVEQIVREKKEKNCIVTLLAGFHDSGKTTLITSIYEYFQRGIKNYPYIFAGSKTLHELEKQCYLTRIISNSNNKPERTLNNANENFLHLCVKRSDIKNKYISENPIYDFFISDFAGEWFTEMNDNDVKIENTRALMMSRQIIFLIDGKKLINFPQDAYEIFPLMKLLLEYVKKTNHEQLKKKYYLIISKWDLIQNMPDSERQIIIKNLEKTIDEMKIDMKESYNIKLEDYTIAARPSKKALLIDKTIVNLFASWIDRK